ncbi:Uncharacterized protein FWK35_00008407 [Aphis craccivora]|uniref:Uncharacterized protein n=1 Tax=Aphis craccivora TaxID=307492 RepID=A0A6G0YVQ2_APHCR|nr:Uncharacterized protein FWK35_00008407 [Aphis craccivora]
MKEQIYVKEVNNRDELLMRIVLLNIKFVGKDWSKLHRCTKKCIEVNGGHVNKAIRASKTRDKLKNDVTSRFIENCHHLTEGVYIKKSLLRVFHIA